MPSADRARERVLEGRALQWVSLGYVSLPFAIFVAGWVRPVVAVPCLAIVAAGLYRASRVEPSGPGAAAPEGGSAGGEAAARESARRAVPGADAEAARRAALRRLAWALALVAFVYVLVHSGTGGYAFQFGGHWRNNSFIRDLAFHDWPLGFDSVGRHGEPGVLAFYIANALGPALVVSWLGWEAGFLFQLLWTALGVALAMAWTMRVIGDVHPRWVFFFLLFGGLDLVGFQVLLGPYDRLMTELDLWIVHYAVRTPEMARTFWIYPANLTLLFNSPHHVLCSWIVLTMIVDDAVHSGTARRIGLLSAFALLWSAFSFVGLAPFVVLALFWTRGRGMLSFENLGAGLVVLGLTFLYITSNRGDYLHGPLWAFQDLRRTVPVLLLVYAVEFGLQALLVRGTERSRDGLGHPVWLGTAIATLVLLAGYRIGDHNDFTTKASVPALMVLQLCVAHALLGRPWRHRWAGWALLFVLLVGAAAPITLVARSARIGLDASAPAIESVAPTNELERRSRGGQLFGDGEAFFWRVLARPIVYSSAGSPSPAPAP